MTVIDLYKVSVDNMPLVILANDSYKTKKELFRGEIKDAPLKYMDEIIGAVNTCFQNKSGNYEAVLMILLSNVYTEVK